MSDVDSFMQMRVDKLSQADESSIRFFNDASLDGSLFSSYQDSLHGPILVGPREAALIKTFAFVRLQEVKQLGFVHRIWPGAVHTRYEHSLGCYHLARRAVRVLFREERGRREISTRSAQAFLLAALLHDIGHYLFSHAIEELGYPLLPHEQIGRSIIERGEVATILERDYHLAPSRVADFIDPPKTRVMHPHDALLRELLSGPLNTDKLDYVPRDAQACGIPYSMRISSALIEELHVGLPVPGEPHLVLTRRATDPLRALLHIRQAMFLNVYWHPDNRIYTTMLVCAVQDALIGGVLPLAQLSTFNDADLLKRLSVPSMPSSTRALTEALRQNEPYKVDLEVRREDECLSDLLTRLAFNAELRRHIEQLLALRLASTLAVEIADYEILLIILRPKNWSIDGWISSETPPFDARACVSWSQATGLSTHDLSQYAQGRYSIYIIASTRVHALLQAVCRGTLLLCLEGLLRGYTSS